MKGLEMVKCESLRINMFRITHTGKSVNFPVTTVVGGGKPEICSKTEFFVFLGICSFGYSILLWKNNFPLILTIFTFLSDFKIPALANGVVTMATRRAFFDFSVVYDVLFWQPSSQTGRI